MCKHYLGNGECKEAYEDPDSDGYVICDGVDHSCTYYEEKEKTGD